MFLWLAFAIIIIVQCQLAVGELISAYLGRHPAVLVRHQGEPGVDGFHHGVDDDFYQPPTYVGHAVVPHSARIGLLNHFLGDQQQRTLEHIEREHHEHHKHQYHKTCTASNKFKGCCQQIEMTSSITDIDSLIDDACKYPPADLSKKQKITLGYYFNEYVMCYADAKDNADCCAGAGVPSIISYAFWTVNCHDLCRGLSATLSANPAWNECSPYKDQIYKCNMNAVDVSTPSAATKRSFCNNAAMCKDPMGWESACTRSG